MKKETARDVAIALIAVSGKQFDGFAFDDCESITENDKQKIMREILIHCQKMIDKIEAKYSIHIGHTTADIIEGIVFE